MASTAAAALRQVSIGVGKAMAAPETPEGVRRVFSTVASALAPSPATPMRTVERAGLPTLQVAPSRFRGVARGTILWFHGGGYVFGTLRAYSGMAGRIARASRCRVHVPEYRLAPEHPSPAATEDGLAAYRALLDREGPGRLLVGGDSAGGHLTVAVLQAARDEGLPMPAGAILLSPWLDATFTSEELRDRSTEEIVIRPELIERCREWFVGDGDLKDPAISPLFGDMNGLPPTYIAWTLNEFLHADCAAFVDKAGQAGVQVTTETHPDLWHVWPLLAPLLPEGRDTIARIGAFAGERLDAAAPA